MSITNMNSESRIASFSLDLQKRTEHFLVLPYGTLSNTAVTSHVLHKVVSATGNSSESRGCSRRHIANNVA